MMYTSKKECYDDVLMSLMTGLLLDTDISILKEHYESLEHYECCQGIVEAFIDYDKLRRKGDTNTQPSANAFEDKSNG